jgi:hypothetical protein
MSYDANNTEIVPEDGTGDLNETLGAGEGDFVTESKPPANRNALVLFGLILAGMAGTYLMYARSGPATATAAAIEAEAAKKQISSFLDGGGTNIQNMERMLRETEKVVQQFVTYPSVTQIPLGDLQTNPFRHKAPKDPSNPAAESEANAKRRLEAERQAVIRAVGELRLQSIIAGTRAACMINNTLYTEGQKVESFIIEKIDPDAVVVRSGNYRFELRMQK